MLSRFIARYAKTTPDREGESGQSLVEYGIAVALIAVVAMASLQALGGGIAGVFGRILGRIAGIG